ncbi:MAG TPA: DUF445 domain-containing protein [Sulfurovum sp.]|jgi:uncharacterized membrane protein YheB (UPF0754 family)|nr:MAG: DUF445 domain-containing protein [Sulfurovum sp. 35-42-20]OYY57374.1 MAG: DUF445 domain-containing protein [Sulfurovum sp. 28-43-6]OYZ24922.1 MAG: DUF445 domain-containing protein [Sulfurovum sp. 16-42-52]OYZ50637.1 MAG: DUF445 domain-containing protein [Sulfurovum sp. 24-42-9]OZA47167.1 MAG: DUF445 domain-containing protein [Sulfurovum sp. 17-42-90]OZA60590.1 MAG: DUF445 domain-containing protein [Sulfurovum sp. 39-42-12]HQR74091.1 DUF445 domain-containing protein [Sulfurovum sp.]
MSKSLLTDLFSILFIGVAFVVPQAYHDALLFTGLFALSGAVTNQLAIHMLFEKVPFLYGSGVIEKNFDTFKLSIKEMMMKQFFTKEQLEAFFHKEEQKIDLVPLVENTDFSPAFDALSKTVMESKFGGAVSLFGGESALEGLREPFSNKLRSAVSAIVSSSVFKAQLEHHIQGSALSEDMLVSIDELITKRLEELSPAMVKALVQELIKEHLGWLVVWGGVFGGLIGLLSAVVF